MKRSAFTWWQGVLSFVGLALIAAVLFPVFGRARDTRKASCQSNLKQISLGIFMYMQDYEEKYPRVHLEGQGWVDMLQPYVKSTQIFQCYNERSGELAGTTDYFYNARLANVSQAKLDFIDRTIMNGDSLGDTPANFSLTKFPATWVTDTNSPAYRHLEGANYSYADGHVKWLKPTAITNEKASGSVTTFAPW